MNGRGIAAVVVLALAAVAGCATQSATGPAAPASTAQATPAPQPSCACSYPPTPPAGAVSRDAAIAAAIRSVPGAGPTTQVVNVNVETDPFGSGRQVWEVRLGTPLSIPSCPGDAMPQTPASASAGPCLDSEGGVWVVLDMMSGAVLGWVH
jgi:hypothetical protein